MWLRYVTLMSRHSKERTKVGSKSPLALKAALR